MNDISRLIKQLLLFSMIHPQIYESPTNIGEFY